MKRIAILGSTGSIGRSTLSVVESYPERFQIVALAAGSNIELALEQALRWKPASSPWLGSRMQVYSPRGSAAPASPGSTLFMAPPARCWSPPIPKSTS